MIIVSPPATLNSAYDPVLYAFTGLDANATVSLTFSINAAASVTLLAFSDSGGNAQIDIADILQPYVKSLNPAITGFDIISFELTAINGNSYQDHTCYAIPATIGKLNAAAGKSLPAVFMSGQNPGCPFFTLRAALTNSVQFYHSELTDLFLYCRTGFSVTFEGWWLNSHGQLVAYQADVFTNVFVRHSASEVGCLSIPDADLSSTLKSIIRVTLADSSNHSGVYYVVIDPDPVADETHLVRFRNSYGAREQILLTGELKEKNSIDGDTTYLKTENHINLRKRQRQTLTDQFTLQTRILNVKRAELLRDMLCSDQVQILIDGVFYDCRVTSDLELDHTPRTPQNTELTFTILNGCNRHRHIHSDDSTVIPSY